MSHKNQFIWQKSVKLSINCYRITKHFPKEELYGLTSQIRRSSVSIASNIAEGYGRVSSKEYVRFLQIANGSMRELDTQLIIAREVGLISQELVAPVIEEVDEMQKIMTVTLQKIEARI
ncbi:four helix bundle protein [Merismopedia glauca]|uniref:Four helix bundle protein n=1 Tax=Merismopedia glauca CCAP 1448/3 TaxID=1296344 RepID=A0A2T1C422_9CYAN|nr:four helix bundle protein [Merismopedia glauca]PSB02974.1 four helix bundle protein [Merismopedia glauca CCAP 1448/3]